MSAPTRNRISPPGFGKRRLNLDYLAGLLIALALVGVIGVLDVLTGYEVRLAIFYMLPIALATWTGGARSGMLVSLAAAAFWGISFDSEKFYSQKIFYYWEWAVLIVTFFIFMLLLSRLRDALARADKRFLHVLEGLHAGIYVVDEGSDDVLYANRQLARMIGADPLSMRAARFEERFNVTHGSPRTPKAAGNFDCDEVRDRQSGRWYLIQSGPIPWENNGRASLKIIMDISEQKQAQQLKRQHQEMLHNTARFAILAEIASVLAHEINQPLMAIASYNDACKRLLSKERYDVREVIEALEKCRLQALRASRIIDRTRDFLRRRAPSPANCNINDVVPEAVRAIELELQDAGVTVDLRLANPLPDTVFDRTLIAQVIINLLRNAVDAVRSAEPDRRSVSIATGIANDEILVSVMDKGAGIPAAIADKLYAPFFTTKPQGLGLGLSICRSVVEAHAGRLWHGPGIDGGASFHFTLPSDAGE